MPRACAWPSPRAACEMIVAASCIESLPRARTSLSQVGARHVLGHQKVDVAVVPGVERPHQVLVIELGLGADLAGEAGDGVGRGAMPRQHLDRHDAAHQPVLGLEHLAHAALADRVDDLVGSEVELRAADLELLGLPAIEPAQLDQLGGQLCVVDYGPGADRAAALRAIAASASRICSTVSNPLASAERRKTVRGRWSTSSAVSRDAAAR